MDILSRRSGPRAEDKQAKQHIQRNWGTIERLADTLSGGKYSADKAKKAAPPPQAEGLIIIDQARPRLPDVPVPYLRISMNGRVVLADTNSGLQLHFLGQIKRLNGQMQFTIATKENGFISALEPEIYDKITDLADRTINRAYSEDDLAEDIKQRLQIA
ncbi:MAG: hypothetical protein ACOH2H_17410 [Cypionkella sp.]